MKKSTILVVSLVAVAALAMWFGREPSDSEQVSSPAISVAEPSLPGVEPPLTENLASDPNVQGAEAHVDVTSSAALSSAEPVNLFSAPDYSSVQYRNALDDAKVIASRYPVQPLRNFRVLVQDDDSLTEMVRQIESGVAEFSQAFVISPPEVGQCTISAVSSISLIASPNRELVVGGPTPVRYRATANCAESGDDVTIGVDNSTPGTIGIGIASLSGGISISSVDEAGFVVVLEHYP